MKYNENKSINGYYVVFGICKRDINLLNKIKMQLDELNIHFKCKFINVASYKRNKIQGALDRVPGLHTKKWKINEALEKIEDPDFLYIRRTVADHDYMCFLKEIRYRYPNCKIIVEFYTYPYYKDELWGIANIGYLIKEIINSRKIKKYVDRIVTYSNDTIINEVDTIRTINAVDMNHIKPRECRKEDDEIHIVAVAMFKIHHGYDRIIKGLAQYKNTGTKKVKFYLVGEGDQIGLYKNMVRENGLQEDVIFFGIKSGKELDDIYNDSDIALGSFGMSRIGMDTISSIKIGEYLAKGLPIIAGCDQAVFKNEKKPDFYLQFSNDESAINIETIVHFYSELKDTYAEMNNLIDRIRYYGEEHVSITAALFEVVKFIGNESGKDI